MGELTKAQMSALRRINVESPLQESCRWGCFRISASSIVGLVRRGLVEAGTSNPTAAQSWRITHAGRAILTQKGE